MTQAAPFPSNLTADELFDELLVVKAQQGDERALERLYLRWNNRLVRSARRYCGAEDTASDLAQECWIAILRGIGSLRDPTRFRSYAFTVLHRRGADYLRKTIKERDNLSDQSEVPDLPQPAAQSDSAAIAQAFAALPADQRLAAHLYFVEGLTLAEIASVQSVPLGTSKSRIFNARQKLKVALTPDYNNPNFEGDNP